MRDLSLRYRVTVTVASALGAVANKRPTINLINYLEYASNDMDLNPTTEFPN